MNYKSLTTIVPGWANWSTVDQDGAIWVWDIRPERLSETWDFSGDFSGTDGRKRALKIGLGPNPQNWRKEIYRLVVDE